MAAGQLVSVLHYLRRLGGGQQDTAPADGELQIGAPDARLTREAKAALVRLAKRQPETPKRSYVSL
jgi:hypothetical protein